MGTWRTSNAADKRTAEQRQGSTRQVRDSPSHMKESGKLKKERWEWKVWRGSEVRGVPAIGTRLMPTATARLSGLANHEQNTGEGVRQRSRAIKIKIK